MPRGSAHRILTGKPRTFGGGARPWRSTLYAPTGSFPKHRLTFKEPTPGASGEPTEVWEWTSRNAESEDEGRKLFAQVEAALDAHQSLPARHKVVAARDMNALGDLYLADSRRRGKAVRTIEQRESKLRAHVRPSIGTVPVARWRLEHSQAVLDRARKTVRSKRGLEDVRQVLSGMRRLAWREGWLARDVDPLDGLELPKAVRTEGADEGYVPPEERPEG